MTSDYRSLRPLGPRVLVQREPLVRESREGLYLIGIDYPTIGKVLAVGPGWRYRKGEQHCSGVLFQTRDSDKREWWQCRKCNYRMRWFNDDHYVTWHHMDIYPGDIVQWSITANFDLYSLGNDLLLLHYNDLNLVQRED